LFSTSNYAVDNLAILKIKMIFNNVLNDDFDA